jgi:hypothetical protein
VVDLLRLDRRLRGRDVGRGRIVVLHRLQPMVDIGRFMGAGGLCEKLIRRERLLMVLQRRHVARHLRVIGRTLIMATAMRCRSGIIGMGLSQREIFCRRRRRRNVVLFSGDVRTGEVLRMLAARSGGSVRPIVVIGRLGLRDQVLIRLCRIGH